MSEPTLVPIAYDQFVAGVQAVAAALDASGWTPDHIVGIGRGGLVQTSIQLNQVSVVDSSTLAGANGFVEAWWNNTQSSPSQAAILSAFQSGISAVTSTSTAEASSEATMIDLRPHASDKPPANSIANASTPVVNDSDIAAPASLTP